MTTSDGRPGRDPLERRAVDLERRQVAGVDADDRGPGVERAVGLGLGVHLDQRRHAERLDPLQQADQRVLLERGDDQQDDVGAVRPRLVHLVAGDDEVLAQHRHVDDRADGVQVGLRAAEAPPLGEHADHAGAAGGVLAGELGGVGDVGEVALGRAAPLDLGDDPDAGGAQRGEGVEGGPGVEGRGLDLGQREERLAGGEVLADAGHDLVEHAHERRRPRELAVSACRTSVPSPADRWTHSRGGAEPPRPGGGCTRPRAVPLRRRSAASARGRSGPRPGRAPSRRPGRGPRRSRGRRRPAGVRRAAGALVAPSHRRPACGPGARRAARRRRPAAPATTASTGQAAETSTVGVPPRPAPVGRGVRSPPVSARSPDQASTPPATATSRPDDDPRRRRGRPAGRPRRPAAPARPPAPAARRRRR